ncbi:hypothetical protein DFH06DRAFT_1466084, partial [Mycena polygramma]
MDIKKHSSLRHPNIIQIYGVASSGGIHATLFHGDLVAFRHCLYLYKHSPCMTVYLYVYCTQKVTDVIHDLYSNFEGETVSSECTLWIRGSTGRLCVDLMGSDDPTYFCYFMKATGLIPEATGLLAHKALSTEAVQSMVIETITLETYREVCFGTLGDFDSILVPTAATLTPGAVVHRPSSGNLVQIASPLDPYMYVEISDWACSRKVPSTILEARRFDCHTVTGRTLPCSCRNVDYKSWISQANHIF